MKGGVKMKDLFDIDEKSLENLDLGDFKILDSEDLSEKDEKSILGASCTTCTCCCSCCA
ncbi:thiazolylpeptide-type bacteriocin precursor [Lactobacillus paragasseri JV-V03]|uniref:Thiazolylpeptide-type bacteriocin n=2 Tax=Lactobacillaceae TaxID=33958 RepID=A0AA86ZXM4_9LACO|nr:thiazolylpeptide-type bacteriocin precursor [Lactobacillus paragasseri JV-V03]